MHKTMTEEKNVDKKVEEPQEEPKKRQIVIETDGTNVNIATAEVAGAIELVGILERIIKQINK